MSDTTDSSTSSISDDMFNINNDIDLLEPIFSKNNSFEVSILRILHILFSEDNTIIHNRLHQYMDNSIWCNNIKEFFYDNPGVMKDANFYKTNAGIYLIEQWVELLEDQNFFTYNLETNREISPNITNFLSFIYNTFPLLKKEDSDNMQTILTNIYTQLNVDIGIVFVSYLKCLPNNQIHKSTIQHIYINNNKISELCYIWEIVEILETYNINQTITIYSESELKFARKN